MRVTELIFEAKIKGVVGRSCCCYGNQLHHKIDSNMFTNDSGSFLIPLFLHQLINSGYNDPPKFTSLKVLEVVLSHLIRTSINV